jgi:mannose-6-phosphate isomerase-like protein (cupin superfamily)
MARFPNVTSNEMKTAYNEIPPFITKDGSTIRELLHPAHHALRAQSFAEAIVPPGATTLRHLHPASEEIYHITRGEGRMMLGDAKFTVGVGDSIAIAPGTPHNITNTGQEPLHILCACTPPYSDEDTVLL